MINDLKFKSLLHLLDYFKEETTCKQALAESRWHGNPTCPHCNIGGAYVTKRGFRCSNKDCRKDFTVITKTVFENTKIPLRIWFAAMYLITAHKKGISSHQLARDLSITQKTAWFVNHRIRKTLVEQAPEMLAGEVEVDETFIGGKNKNRHFDKKVKESQGRSVKDKTPVFGMFERGGKLRLQVVKDTKAKSLLPAIWANVKPNSVVISDEWLGYSRLGKNFNHEVINHKKYEYVRGTMHTNTVEGAWSLLKRGIVGIYHYVSPKHLHRYCAEFSYRYNSRQITDCERFAVVLTHTGGRLKYNDLIAKIAA